VREFFRGFFVFSFLELKIFVKHIQPIQRNELKSSFRPRKSFNILRMGKILITGATGNVGGELIKICSRENVDAVASTVCYKTTQVLKHKIRNVNISELKN